MKKSTEGNASDHRRHPKGTRKNCLIYRSKKLRVMPKKQRMQTLVEKLNKEIPGLNLAIDGTTGALDKEKTAVDGLIESNEKMALFKIAEEQQ